MGVAAYSSALNVVPAPAAGTGSMGYAVCNPANGGFVVANTANRAGGAVEIAGVALENFVSGVQFRVATSGYIPADVVGSLTGSGRYVSVDSTGKLYRASIISSDTIGTYNTADGSVFMAPDYQFGGGSGNASSIQGTAVGAVSPGYSKLLAGNGTTIRSRAGTYNFLDFRDDTVALDSSAGAMAANKAAWDLAMSTIGNGSELFFPKGDYFVGDEWTAWNGYNYLGSIGDIALTFENGHTAGSPGARLIANFDDPQGNAATISTIGETGQVMMTMTGCTSIYGIAITTANASKLVGRPIRVWNSTTADDNLSTTVVAIPSNGTIVCWNPRASAAAPDYGLGGSIGNGKVCWRIERAMIDLRIREFYIDRMNAQTVSAHGLGCLLRVTESPSPAAATGTSTTITNNKLRDCFFHTDAQTQKTRFGIRLADDVVYDSNHTLGQSPYVTSPSGYRFVQTPYQVDVTEYENCRFSGAIGSGFSAVGAVGRAGQAESHTFMHCSFNGVRCSWITLRCSTTGSNLGHASFDMCGFAHAYDTHVDICTSSFGVRISGCQCESGPSRLLLDRGGVTMRSVLVEGVEMQFNNSAGAAPSTAHPSWEVISTNSEGVIAVERCSFYTGDTDTRTILALNHSQGASNNRAATVSFRCVQVFGSRSISGRRVPILAGRRGPYRFAGTETLDVKVDGSTTTVTFSAANFNTALAAMAGGYVVNMDEVRAWEVALLVEHFVGRANMRAWGSEEDEELKFWSNNQATGTVQVTGGTANTQLGFNTGGIGTNVAQLQMQKDTAGLISGSPTSSSDEVELVFATNAIGTVATNAHTTLPSFCKVYPTGGTNTGSFKLEGVSGISASRGVPPRNLNGSITISGATATGTVTLPATEDDASYLVVSLGVVSTSAAPATRSARVQNGSQTTGQFVVELDAAPGVGQSVQVNWVVMR